MAWTNSGYMSLATDALRLAGARLFAGEIMDAISADVSADGKSRSSGSLTSLLSAVRADIAELERAAGRGRPAVGYADLRGGT